MATMQENYEKLQRELENERQKTEAIIYQLQQLQKKTQQNEEEIKDLKQQLQQKEQKAEALGDDIEMPNFKQYKDNQEVWYSPPRYTHPGGYRFGIAVCANTGYDRMSVYLYSVTGMFDRLLKPTMGYSITLLLLNQEGDENHIVVNSQFTLSVTAVHQGYVFLYPVDQLSRRFSPHQPFLNLYHKNLEYNAIKGTCFLKNNCLLFRVAKVDLNLCTTDFTFS